jgi:DNA-directed RNA polymerase subunit H (RpoH/RPB5)
MSTSGHYTPLEIYKNLPTFFEYRLLELVSGSQSMDGKKIKSLGKSWLTDNEFIKTIQFQGYVLIEAEDSSVRVRQLKTVPLVARKLPVKTLIILFDDIDKYTKTQPYKQLIERLPHVQEPRKYNLDIITISRDGPSVHLRKAIANIERPGSASNGYIKIFSRKYVLLRNTNPEHVNVPKCRVLSEEEKLEMLAALHTDQIQLPRVFDSDSIIVWYPVEIGDIIEELHVSENVGWEKMYRLVVPTPQIEK